MHIYTCTYAQKHTDKHTYIHTYTHAYIHTCMHTYTHAYTHILLPLCEDREVSGLFEDDAFVATLGGNKRQRTALKRAARVIEVPAIAHTWWRQGSSEF